MSSVRLYLESCIYIAEEQMMAKDENLKQVHNLAAVPEGADKVTTPCFSNMYIVQVGVGKET